ncbi:hypothetical protein AFLA_007912 [Aspergillus flavus NRRL3357]|nr:hypothetical protein AFLA_007912 [Aspergillus flavus NRRL3357]
MTYWILKQLKILVNLTERVVGDTKRYTNQGKDQYAKGETEDDRQAQTRLAGLVLLIIVSRRKLPSRVQAKSKSKREREKVKKRQSMAREMIGGNDIFITLFFQENPLKQMLCRSIGCGCVDQLGLGERFRTVIQTRPISPFTALPTYRLTTSFTGNSVTELAPVATE